MKDKIIASEWCQCKGMSRHIHQGLLIYFEDGTNKDDEDKCLTRKTFKGELMERW